MVEVMICLWLFRQEAFRLDSLALPSTGSNNAARMAMMAITTNNSTRVNAHLVAKLILADRSCSRPAGKIGGFIRLRGVIIIRADSRLAMQKAGTDGVVRLHVLDKGNGGRFIHHLHDGIPSPVGFGLFYWP